LGLEPFKQAAYADDAKEKEGVVWVD
jgi:hypothetical protein